MCTTMRRRRYKDLIGVVLYDRGYFFMVRKSVTGEDPRFLYEAESTYNFGSK